ncbi:MAG: DUF5009 domain-containing protein [Bacteroidales bacterium]|nr:DUF5009 domain-containing protein [Bacteroidales bacterium]
MSRRNLALDIFRALTMTLMVFVNDFWAVLDVPHWLEHFDTMEDGMGLSDIIYPMFLFAMGMSVPYALERRFEKGAPLGETIRHILSRTLALLIMGAFICNAESAPMAGNKGVYWLLMVVGFFLVWGVYSEDFEYKKLCRITGAILLTALAVTFRTESGELFRAGWWGILGQIGWMYLFAASVYLLCREKPWMIIAVWITLCLVNLSVAPMKNGSELVGGNFLYDFTEALHLGNGHSAIMALGGVITVIYEKKIGKDKVLKGLGIAALLALAGFLTNRGWIVSKNLGTLPWCMYVSGISVALYTVLRVLEERGITSWANPISPAGKATLTVYMIPYLFYSFWVFLNPTIPSWLSGYVGVGKCALFSALCIATAWGLGKAGIRLKI